MKLQAFFCRVGTWNRISIPNTDLDPDPEGHRIRIEYGSETLHSRMPNYSAINNVHCITIIQVPTFGIIRKFNVTSNGKILIQIRPVVIQTFAIIK